MNILPLLLLLVSYSYVAFGEHENITIATLLGDVTGLSHDAYLEFRGLPYAENAPVGQYRFKKSLVRTSAYADEVYDATQYGSSCIQYASSETDQSEDCLFLNVYVPSDVSMENGTITSALPVMVWIHGGAFISGSGKTTPGWPFLRKSNVVFVSINYRLAALGFLALDSIVDETNGETTGGMNGVHDQIVALQWVQHHISDFGGDPEQVTIFGESAGGHSVCFLSLMPAAANLFDRAILQSGNCSPPRGKQSTREEGAEISLGVLADKNVTADLEALRAEDAATFKYMTSVRPSVDGFFLQNTTHNMLLNGEYSLNVDKLIVGSNSLDSLQLYPYFVGKTPPPLNDDEFRRLMREYLIVDSDIERLLSVYYPLSDFVPSSYTYGSRDETYTEQTMRWTTLNADVCYKCPTVFYATQLLAHSGDILEDSAIFLYNFIGPQPPNYMSHASDIPFLFYNATAFPFSFWGETGDEALSDYMIDAWINFAVNGDPSSTLNQEQWAPFQVNRSAMIIGDDGSNAEGVYAMNAQRFDTEYYRSGVCTFWIEEIGFDLTTPLCLQSYTLAPTAAPTAQPTVDLVESTELLTTESPDESGTVSQLQNVVIWSVMIVYHIWV